MRGNPGTKPQSGIAEAVERTGLVIRGLRERMADASKAPGPKSAQAPAAGDPAATGEPPAADESTANHPPTADPAPATVEEPAAESPATPMGQDLEIDLEIELAKYFTLHEGQSGRQGYALEQLRERVVDGVAERILRQWERDGESAAFAAAFENGVLERLIQRMFERLTAAKTGANKDRDAPPASPSVAA